MRRLAGRLLAATALATVTLGCGIIELEAEEPDVDGLEFEEPGDDVDAEPGGDVEGDEVEGDEG